MKGLMFDLDGTLLLGDKALGGYQLLPDSIHVLTTLRDRGFPFVVLTNGSAYPPPEQAAKLRGLGLPVEDAQMLTPSSVAADLLARRKVRSALILGSRGVGYALEQAGVKAVFTGEPGAAEAEAVYVGWHPDCHMRDIEAACHAIWNGAKLYVASDVPFFATRQGRTMGYSYAIVGAIRRMTKVPMTLTGKPSLHALRYIARKLQLKPAEIGVVGDDPAVEIEMAVKGGATGFAVTTGVTDRAAWESQPATRRPHHVLGSLREVLDFLPR
jgi:4-nitrophenyl phosphatase